MPIFGLNLRWPEVSPGWFGIAIIFVTIAVLGVVFVQMYKGYPLTCPGEFLPQSKCETVLSETEATKIDDIKENVENLNNFIGPFKVAEDTLEKKISSMLENKFVKIDTKLEINKVLFQSGGYTTSKADVSCLNSDNKCRDEKGHRFIRKQITFPKKYSDKPQVHVALRYIHLFPPDKVSKPKKNESVTLYVTVEEDSLTSEGFSLLFKTWYDSKIAEVGMIWFAYKDEPIEVPIVKPND